MPQSAEQSYDLIVVGSGPGGYVAAIRAAQLGLRTAVVERDQLGGVCLNWGCIPTKALLRAAEIKHLAQQAADFGLVIPEVGFDLPKLVERTRTVARSLNRGVSHLLKKSKVTVVKGQARLQGPGILSVSGAQPMQLRAPHIILATGARPRILPLLEPAGDLVWTYFEAMVPKSPLPKRIAVIGAGAIGMEFASFYHDMGVEVAVIERLAQALPLEDAEIATEVTRQFQERGITMHLGAELLEVTSEVTSEAPPQAKELRLSLRQKAERKEVTADVLISAVGVQGNVEELGLDSCGIVAKNGVIPVTAGGRTSAAGIYAIGDVAGAPMLAHKASHEGIACVEALAAAKKSPDSAAPAAHDAVIASCTYCRPQVASLGLSEDAARALGAPIKVGRFPFAGNGKALALGESHGFVKTIFAADDGHLLGAHLVGPEVTELIGTFALAMKLETTEAELMSTVFPHPTVSEAIPESAMAAFGRAIHF